MANYCSTVLGENVIKITIFFIFVKRIIRKKTAIFLLNKKILYIYYIIFYKVVYHN